MTLPSDASPAEVLLAHLPLIGDFVESLARRYRLSPEDADDLEGFVRMRLVENDYRIMRSYLGLGEIRTYLTVVVANLFADYRNLLWGRWRTSATARRLGPVARALETLTRRDGLTFAEAARALRHQGIAVPDAELQEIWAQLPERPPIRAGRQIATDTVPEIRDQAPSPEEAAIRAELRGRITTTLAAAWRTLSAAERLWLRLHFQHGVSVPAIARTQREKPAALYRRIAAALRRLRRELHKAGIRRFDVVELLGSVELEDWRRFDPEAEASAGEAEQNFPEQS